MHNDAKWHVSWKDIIWLILLISGFAMHWSAFATRLDAVESVINGNSQQGPMLSRMAALEQAVFDIRDGLKDIKDELRK